MKHADQLLMIDTLLHRHTLLLCPFSLLLIKQKLFSVSFILNKTLDTQQQQQQQQCSCWRIYTTSQDVDF